ncbi:hypothetical protein BB558_002380 [Smittium angustum]|uniref:DNA topoisomerase 2 n=1 Tax=Smittium angustum TaxID=133377 RepID=A0A2U1J952_SMIAN|nr:hypothetical protein BB558_002380 [Smittium angustum]
MSEGSPSIPPRASSSNKKRLVEESDYESDEFDPSPAKKATKKTSASNKSKISSSDSPQIPTIKRTINGKAVEEIYQKKSQLEHILLRPDTYIGSTEPIEENMWVYNKITERMTKKMVKYTPGLYKIVDEIIVNAADNKIRDPNMEVIKITIDQEKGEISVYNDGKGIPIEMHNEEKVYIPELIFGHLLTSSNYNDNEKKVTGGRNGYGAKLCNIFSKHFEIETSDSVHGKKYKQIFSENMSKKGKPSITKFSNKTEYTKVTFIPDFEKFKMEHLDDGITELLTRRVYDLAGCVPGVKVYLNGERIKIKNFKEYVDLYVQPPKSEQTDPNDVKPIQTKNAVVYQRFNDRWEVGFAVTDGQFQQVSFVNSVNTVKGGTHVNYITDQITAKIIANIKKKSKNSNVRPYQVKGHIWIFVNTLVENPAFDSQTKETLTLRSSSFGSKCEIDDDFMKKVMKTEISSLVMNFVKFKEQQSLKKTDGAKSGRISGIAKLDDANQAGTRSSKNCTLILTEGDSAKTLAVSGISVIGRDHYGVFPLKGKLLNVRDATSKQVTDNAEISQIKQILGLKHGQDYKSTDNLRYGHLMIMADQDVDGSHIKGLIINFMDSYFPSLMKIPGFLLDFMTPVVKATKKQKSISFYSEPEFAEWQRSVPNGGKDWTIKYYKGLGTSTAQEAREYFSNLEHHRKQFLPAAEEDRKLVDLAFSKSRADDRKEWLASYVPGTYLDTKIKEVPVSDFINKELVLYSIADTARSIPSMVDGFKPTQRKIMYGCFKRNLKNEIKVAALAGYISEQTAYHHGEQSLTQTIVSMAYDFVGSNNINLLDPRGQFGSRLMGGKDAASARYIFTTISQIARSVFDMTDNTLLNYLEDDGKPVEPQWYIPVVPMVLINGAEGIGTGWSTSIPNYNPIDIINNLKNLINGNEPTPMIPWYRGFNGEIEYVSPNRYRSKGIIEQIDETTLRITELPVKTWTQSYKDQLELWRTGNDKIQPIIKDFKEYHTETRVDFYLTLTEQQMNAALKEGLETRFKLTSSISTSNMVCFDKEGRIKRYDSPESILLEFYPLRLRYYQLRKEALATQLTEEWERYNNRARFVLEIIQKKLIVQNRKRVDIIADLVGRGYKKIPKSNKPGTKAHKNDKDDFGNENDSDGEASDMEQISSGGATAGDYDYLLSMPIWSLTYEKFEKLNKERDDCQARLDTLLSKSPKDLWVSDLDNFEKFWNMKLEYHENMELDEADAQKNHKKKYGIGAKSRKKRTSLTTATKPKSSKKIKPEDSENDSDANSFIDDDSEDDFKVTKKVNSKASSSKSSPLSKPSKAPRAQGKAAKTNGNSKMKPLTIKDEDIPKSEDVKRVDKKKVISVDVKKEPEVENLISDDETYSKPLSLSDRLNMIRNKKASQEVQNSVPKHNFIIDLSPKPEVKPNVSKVNGGSRQPTLSFEKKPLVKEKPVVKKPAATKKTVKKPNSKVMIDSESEVEEEVIKKQISKQPEQNAPSSGSGRAKRTAAKKVNKYKIDSESASEGESENDNYSEAFSDED